MFAVDAAGAHGQPMNGRVVLSDNVKVYTYRVIDSIGYTLTKWLEALTVSLFSTERAINEVFRQSTAAFGVWRTVKRDAL